MPTAPIVRLVKKRKYLVWAEEHVDPFFELVEQYLGQSFFKLENAVKQLPVRGVNRTIVTTLFSLQKKNISSDISERMSFWKRVSLLRETQGEDDDLDRFRAHLRSEISEELLGRDFFADAFPHALITKAYLTEARHKTCIAFNQLQWRRIDALSIEVEVNGKTYSWKGVDRSLLASASDEVVFRTKNESWISTAQDLSATLSHRR